MTCNRPPEQHYLQVGGYVICDDEGHPILDDRKTATFFRTSEKGWYPLITKWTRKRMSRERFIRQCCVPHVLVSVRLEIGLYGGKLDFLPLSAFKGVPEK